MKASFVMNPGLCADEMCDSIIADAEKLPVEAATIDRGDINKEMRRAEVRWLHTHEENWRDMAALFTNFMRQANTMFGFDVDWIQVFQYTVYSAADLGHYDEHVDVFFDDRSMDHRKISMVLQLSDPADYDGGDLVLRTLFGPAPEPVPLRQRGSLIMFPSFTPHKVTPVTRGVRKSLVGWFSGPQFR